MVGSKTRLACHETSESEHWITKQWVCESASLQMNHSLGENNSERRSYTASCHASFSAATVNVSAATPGLWNQPCQLERVAKRALARDSPATTTTTSLHTHSRTRVNAQARMWLHLFPVTYTWPPCVFFLISLMNTLLHEYHVSRNHSQTQWKESFYMALMVER